MLAPSRFAIVGVIANCRVGPASNTVKRINEGHTGAASALPRKNVPSAGADELKP